jgi:uncharacterized protein
MTLLVLSALFLAGIAIGLASGLVGIGGGVLIVPLLYFFYEHPALVGAYVEPALRTSIAHATSLAVILPTAIRGTLAYRRERLVASSIVLPIGLAALGAAVLGARLALVLPAAVLRLVFGLLLVASGTQLIFRSLPAQQGTPQPRLALSIATGFLVGLLSATLGLGGGIIAIPLLIYAVRVELARVAATSLALVAFAAAAGTLTYALSGWGLAGRPPLTLGYVHFGAALPILLGSILSVRWGARLNQRLSSRRLRLIFGGLFIAFGLALAVQHAARLLH